VYVCVLYLSDNVDEEVCECHAPDEGVLQHVVDQLLQHVGLGLVLAVSRLGGSRLDRREAKVLRLVLAAGQTAPVTAWPIADLSADLSIPHTHTLALAGHRCIRCRSTGHDLEWL
jgi:hypothetical protein